MEEDFAFIGLGAMGYAMAQNIRQKISPSSKLFVHDINSSACKTFAAEFGSLGPIEIASSAKDAAAQATIVISIVPDAADVRKVYLDETNGVIAAPQDEKRLMLECSTIDSKSTVEVGEQLKAAGHGIYIDTPVSGGVPGAKAGSLAFLIGNSEPTEDDANSTRLERVLSMMGAKEKFFYCGRLGAGLAAKISNNYLSCTILLATAEALAIGIKSGIDKKVLYNAIHNSTGQSWMLDHVCPVPDILDHVPSSNNYQLGFKTQMLIKDMSLGLEAGLATGIQPTMAEAAIEVFKRAAKDPQCIDRDGSSVYLHIGGPVDS